MNNGSVARLRRMSNAIVSAEMKKPMVKLIELPFIQQF
jgi:hypothetical protein